MKRSEAKEGGGRRPYNGDIWLCVTDVSCLVNNDLYWTFCPGVSSSAGHGQTFLCPVMDLMATTNTEKSKHQLIFFHQNISSGCDTDLGMSQEKCDS